MLGFDSAWKPERWDWDDKLLWGLSLETAACWDQPLESLSSQDIQEYSYRADVGLAGEQVYSHLGSYPGPPGVVEGLLQPEKAERWLPRDWGRSSTWPPGIEVYLPGCRLRKKEGSCKTLEASFWKHHMTQKG